MVNIWKLEEHSGKGKYNTEYVYDIISFLQVLSKELLHKRLVQVQEEAVKDDNQTAGGLLLKSSLNLQEITLS